MKKLLFLAFAAFFALSITGQSQALKFGHIDTQGLISVMPETTAAQANLEKEAKGLEEALETMQVEYNNKLNTYVTERETMGDLVRQAKEQELTEFQQRIQAFEQQAQQGLQQKQGELFQPVMEKAKKAIEEVAKENKLIYVFDLGAGALLYYSDQSEDILPLVKAKLGIE